MAATHKRWIATGFSIAFVGGVLAGGYSLYRVSQTIRNAYAVWWVADMVVEHMRANEGHWPRSWDDLRDDYQTCIKRSGQPWSFAELSQRVVVDWTVDSAQLQSQSVEEGSAAFKVITLSDGTDSHWESSEPNQIILEYLQSVRGSKTDESMTTGAEKQNSSPASPDDQVTRD